MTPTCGECNDELLTEDEEACGFCRACEAAQWERGETVDHFRDATEMVGMESTAVADVFFYGSGGIPYVVEMPPEPA